MKKPDVNIDFLLEIWHDLREKRLAPVAIALLVSLVAIPALLRGGGEEAGSPSPLPITASGSGSEAKVEVAQELAEQGSKLDSYDKRDPFDSPLPGGGADKDENQDSGKAIAPGDGALTGEDKATGGGGGGGGGTAPAETGSGKSDGSGGSSAPQVKRTSTFYNFNLKLEFGRPGREKRYKSVSRLEMLPSDRSALLVYMGVTESQKTAVFFVDSSLNQQGEGSCRPSPSDCRFLYLRSGQEHYFSTDGGREYRLELIAIKRVRASSEKKQRAAARKSARSARKARASGNATPREQELEWPFLVDGQGRAVETTR